jgi:hypothetical protein
MKKKILNNSELLYISLPRKCRNLHSPCFKKSKEKNKINNKNKIIKTCKEREGRGEREKIRATLGACGIEIKVLLEPRELVSVSLIAELACRQTVLYSKNCFTLF